MAPTPLITIVGSLVLAAGIFFGYLALKLAKLVVKNLLARQSVERAGFARPNAPGYSFFKGHVDLFINAGGSFTAMMQWLDRNDPGLPDTFVVYISLFRTLLVTRDPDVAYQVLLKKNYPKDVYESITELVGAGLLTSGGEVWAKKRRIMNAGFKPDFLKTAMVPKFASYAKIMCDAMDRDLEARRGPEKNWVDMAEVLSRVTLDIIGDTAFGHHFNFTTSGDDDDTARIKAMVFTTLSEPSKMLVNPFRKFTHPRQTYHYYQELARFKRMGLEIVRKARVKTTEGKDDGETNILSLILKMGQLSTDDRLSDQEILDEVMTFLIAGHETTASTASFALLYLGQHPEALAKAVAEVDSILSTPTSVCGYEEQNKMEYLGAIFKEVLRLQPIAPAALRNVPAGETIDGKVLDREASIIIPYAPLHRNKKLWGEDADEFKPERWLGESPVKHLFSYLPFSQGPRICIGKDFALLEFRVLLATFLRRFRFKVPRDLAYRNTFLPTDPDFGAEPGDKANRPLGFEVAFSEAITMRPRECLVAVEPREK